MKNLNEIFDILLCNNDEKAKEDRFLIKWKFIKPFLHYNNIVGSSKFVTGKYQSRHYHYATLPLFTSHKIK